MKNSKLIAQILNIKNIKKININSNLDNFTWDSMSMITLISILEEKYKKKIKTSSIRLIKTIKELDDLISKTIK